MLTRTCMAAVLLKVTQEYCAFSKPSCNPTFTTNCSSFHYLYKGVGMRGGGRGRRGKGGGIAGGIWGNGRMQDFWYVGRKWKTSLIILSSVNSREVIEGKWETGERKGNWKQERGVWKAGNSDPLTPPPYPQPWPWQIKTKKIIYTSYGISL